MKKSFVVPYLSTGLFASAPGINLADINIVPQNTAAAPTIPTAVLQQLTQTPVGQSRTRSTQLASVDRRLGVAGITGPVAAYSVPASIGGLTLTPPSEINKQTSVLAPNVLILDRNMTPSAFFPSSCFTYQRPSTMSADRLEDIVRLMPALGQQRLYVLVFTIDEDLQQITTLFDPAKTCAKGVGNAVPDVPDPIARHTTDGLLELRAKTNSSSSVLVGPLSGSSGPGPVTVGSTAAPAVAYAVLAAAAAALAPQPVEEGEPMLSGTESCFDRVIKDVVARGDVDKALKLPDEAERLGFKSTRSTFINSIKGKG